MLYTRYKNKFFIILTILWICLIFSFSLQSGEESSELSSGFGAWLMEHILSIFSIENMLPEQIDMFHLILRKCAHFTEFFVLGVLMYLTVAQSVAVRKCIIAFMLCMLVGAMDETLQLFVDGRAGRVIDVLIDSSGSLVGIIIMKMLVVWKR